MSWTRAATSLLLAFCIGVATLVDGASVPLTLLTDSKARCMDGTLSGYYYQGKQSPIPNFKLLIFLFCSKQ